MRKEIIIEGMSCSHCSSRVEKALNSIEGINATVDLEHKKALVLSEKDVSNEILSSSIEDIGFKVGEIN